ncbi:hypothetical protein GCM10022254_09380 [Actinomadura meridiana]|uniref:RNA polymerase alpha subunit C-terminal domain-containing protein n=1 Tax=Actinomadura meridiana TaxID=559626 RepID=A0ABP8BTN2_9ACTN
MITRTLQPGDSIDALNLPARPRNALHRQGITTISALTQCEPADLLDIRTVGAWSVDAIRTALAEHGLALADSR